MGDVTGLKVFNESVGHEKGDELLIKAAQGIKKVCRREDVAARWGGDEFVIVLPKTEYQKAADIVNRIKQQFLHEEVSNLQVSVSFGWDTKKSPGEDILNVLKKAEDFMYENKIIENEVIRGNVISSINKTLFEKNEREKQHSNRVGDICQQIGEALGRSFTEASRMRAAGMLHDIGKIAIDDEILKKPGTLTAVEWDEVKRHTGLAKNIIPHLAYGYMANGILTHYERW
jgi:diguanylate cyclase (GGDEF)-like protein